MENFKKIENIKVEKTKYSSDELSISAHGETYVYINIPKGCRCSSKVYEQVQKILISLPVRYMTVGEVKTRIREKYQKPCTVRVVRRKNGNHSIFLFSSYCFDQKLMETLARPGF